MGAITSSQYERAEVDALFQSGLFDKAPRLGKFFLYICDRYFDGRADQIKEYSIAVEALGRPEDFDSKRDSIVRVEAHRLRKRLDEYYKGPGADRRIQVTIPNGQYRPQFVLREAPAQSRLESIAAIGPMFVPEIPISEPAQRRRRWVWVAWPALAAVVLGIGVLLIVRLHREHIAPPPLQEDVWTGSTVDPVPTEFRMLAGYHGAPVTDRQGHTWVSDAYYQGGTSAAIAPEHFIEGLPDPHLLRSQRSGSFKYDIPLAQGTHELRLYFAETDYGRGNPQGGGEGSRTFNLSLNGQVVDRVMDALAGAGAPNRLYERAFKDVVPASDGKLHLSFESASGPATLNAIEILSTTPGRVHPIRIVTQGSPVTDSDGRVWAADQFYYGGTLVFRRNVVLDRPERVLFQGERYGNFSYRIPLAPGKYRLKMHFVETWFGTAESDFQPLDTRVFDVYANGVALLRNFEVGKDAGGPNHIIEKTFENLQPNAQGVLLLEFVPVKNYAEVNALEVVETE